MTRVWVERHKKIKETVEKIIQERDCGFVSDTTVASTLNIDPRTVRSHFEIMSIDGYGECLEPECKSFCPEYKIKEIWNRIREKKREPS
jgi:hypothetical protein